MNQLFYDYFVPLKRKPHVNQDVLNIILDRIASNPRISKQEGVPHHFGSFFLPVHEESRSIYLAHHIKADDWIPPGGHVDKGESPLTALRREFEEELSHKLTNEDIELFDVSVKHLSGQRPECLVHYDTWHLVYTDKIDFKFDKKEFHDGSWFTVEEGIKMTQKNPSYKKIMEKLRSHL